jgi:hypothetical protein
VIGYYLKKRYIFKENSLVVKRLTKKEDIPYASMTHIEDSSDLFGTVSILITYNDLDGKKAYSNTSPKKKEMFLSKLTSKVSDPSIIVKKDADSMKAPMGYAPTGYISAGDVYRTKVSVVAYAILCCVILIISFILFVFFYSVDMGYAFIFFGVFAILALFIIVFILWARRKIRYTFKENTLMIESILRSMKIEIQYTSIVEAKEMSSYGIFSNNVYGLSMDLIEITYNLGAGKIFISPERREEFLIKLGSKLSDPRKVVRKSPGRR